MRSAILTLASVFTLSLSLSACNQDGTPQQQVFEDRLAPGVSTEGEVRLIYGAPSMVWEEEGGTRMLEFVKGPAGHRTFMIQIGADGKLKSVEQVLKPAMFMKVVQGMSQDQVRRLIGAPGKKVPFPAMGETGWYFRYLEGTESRYFVVQFNQSTGLVTKTMMMPDMEAGENRGG
jgi:hypothetical protein